MKRDPVECAFHINTDKNNPVCMEQEIINELQKFARDFKKINISASKDTIKELKKIYDCDYESCLLTKGEIIDVIGKYKVDRQLTERFRPEGPYEGEDWFSNIHIDSVLDQIEKKYKNQGFKHVPFQMRDFEKINGELSKVDFIKEYQNGTKSIGVVFNTDKSTERGQHWYAVFIDLRKTPITIEYFNSSGEEPQNEIREWMKKTKHKIEKGLNIKTEDVIVSKIQHQKDNHSCGSYSIYYILSRLENVPYIVFSKKRIPDEMMHIFRFNIFRKEK